MLVELYKVWITICVTVGLLIGFCSPWVLAAYIIWDALHAG